jgi:DNA replication protein DnaC
VTFDIEHTTLSNEEVSRLEERHPRLNLDPEKYCPTCNKGPYLWRGETVCNCRRQLALYKHYLAAGIGVPYQRLGWNDFVVTTPGKAVLMEKLGEYMDLHVRYINRGIGLFFSGQRGVGKTMLATLVLKEFVKNGYSCYYSTFANTITMLTASWKGERRYFQKKFVDSEVLLLDDIGREHHAETSNLPESTFDTILRTRVQEGRATFLTTNLTPVEVENGYGSAVLSLLKEQSIYQEFTGEDYRSEMNKRTLAEVQAGEMRPIF